MKIKTELENLTNSDIYSLMLFALYKSTQDSRHAALSQLAYILDKDNLLRLCEFFGGLTITIPKVEELEQLVYALLMFQQIDVEHIPQDTVIEDLSQKQVDVESVNTSYMVIKELLKNYDFNSGRN